MYRESSQTDQKHKPYLGQETETEVIWSDLKSSVGGGGEGEGGVIIVMIKMHCKQFQTPFSEPTIHRLL